MADTPCQPNIGRKLGPGQGQGLGVAIRGIQRLPVAPAKGLAGPPKKGEGTPKLASYKCIIMAIQGPKDNKAWKPKEIPVIWDKPS